MDLNFRVFGYKEMRASTNMCNKYLANNTLTSEPFSFFFSVVKKKKKTYLNNGDTKHSKNSVYTVF